MKFCVLLLVFATVFASGQRITTIQLDGVQYFVSRMNPYSPELNYFLAYQYCRSLGLQLASFETKEKADTMTQYLKNAGYTKYDFWTSGNNLGTDMYLWMSSGLPFNATFDYMLRRSGNRAVDVPPGTEPQRVARESGDSGSADGCVAMIAPTLAWDAQDCTLVKDFICEQTRCYYYNYGSIPVSATQGNRRPYLTTTTSPTNDIDEASETRKVSESTEEDETMEEASASETGNNDLENGEATGSTGASENSHESRTPEDPVVGRLMTTSGGSIDSSLSKESKKDEMVTANEEQERSISIEAAKATRPDDIPDITSLFTDGPIVQARKETAFDGLETHEIRSSSRSSARGKLEHREKIDNEEHESNLPSQTDAPDNGLEDSHTIGPYDSVQEDYVNDQPDDDDVGNKSGAAISLADSSAIGGQIDKEQQQQDEDSSTFIPEAEPGYRYNMKWRSMGKVVDPPTPAI